MHSKEFSSVEKANQVAEQMQMAVFEKHGSAAQKGLYALTILMIVFIAWSANSESDVCAEAKGRLEPRTKVQLIKPSADGTVLEYKVQDGQQVKQGETLIMLNTIRAEAELKKKQEELSILQSQLKEHENARDGLARIIANPKFSGKDSLAIPEVERTAGELYASKKSLDSASYDMSLATADKPSRMSSQMSVLQFKKQKLQAAKDARNESIQQKSAERDAEKKKLAARIESLSTAVAKARTQLSELQAGLDDAKKEMDIYEKGKRLGVASEVKFLEVQNYLHQREFSVAQQKLQIEELEKDLNVAKMEFESSSFAYNADQAELGASVMNSNTEISSVPLSENETVRALQNKQSAFEVAAYHASSRYSKELTEISSLQRKIDECKAAVTVLQAILAEKYIKAPVDGNVSNLVHLLPGEVVLRGQTLMAIVPSDKELILRAEVNNTDVGFIELGQNARLSIPAYPCAEFGVVQGKVVRVDDYPEEIMDNEKKVSAYKISIQPAQSFIKHDNKNIELKPGLLVHAAIVLRKRSMLGLLFEPLMRVFEEHSLQRFSKTGAVVKRTIFSITG
ncbi:MAG: HlyD family efflux transporter periplasmic adaptor subunit [Candidatus Obscuribacterales bacterium]|nr:HlyD family efflux transporter periplasmic adaptor subunit [Candidatus Obscuribacterales bacterium]